MVILRFGTDFGESIEEFETIDPATRAQYLAKAATLKLADQYFWRSGEQFDMKKVALWEIQMWVKRGYFAITQLPGQGQSVSIRYSTIWDICMAGG